MSTDDAAACRQRLEAFLQDLVQTKSDAPDAAVSEGECANLIEELRSIWSRNSDIAWGLDPSPIDTALRVILFDLISVISISEPAFVEVWYLIDITTILADHDLSEPSSNFQLVENLLDSQTVSGCRTVFDYLESRRDKLIAKNFEKKQLVILRCCNELLRRLSRAEDTVFCGRVFIFLFQSFPLGDRSSVNLRGEFHKENVTHFDPEPKKSDDATKPMELDVDGARPGSSGGQTPASSSVDADKIGRSTPIPGKSRTDNKGKPVAPDLDALFPQFWSLQNLFSQPTRLFEPTAMAQFKDGMASTMACFKALSTNATTSLEPPERGLKRKRGEIDGQRVHQPYNPKYLTNRDLFDLEVHDIAFRRHVLAQCLIMLDFLLSLSPSAKAKTQGLTNKSVLYTFTLSEEDVKYCQNTRNTIATYLQQQGPGIDGKSYYRMVDTVLSRDKNWVRWKAENCQAVAKPGVEVETFMAAQQSLCDATKKRPFPNPPGARDFDFLSQTEPLEALKHPSRRENVRTLEDYYQEIEGAKLDEDFADDEEKKVLQEKIQGSLWRALRASALVGRRFELCEKIKDGANTKALIGADDLPVEEVDDAQPKTEEPEEKPATNGHVSVTDDEAPATSTPVPQDDGAHDVGGEGEATVQAEPTKEEPDDDEFAPPGAMDVDQEPEPAGELDANTKADDGPVQEEIAVDDMAAAN